MLGEIIGELTGKMTGFRVLPAECCPKMESTFQDIGQVLDVGISNTGTFWTIFKEDGGLYGEGQGIAMTNDGEVITWSGQGVGKLNGKVAEWRASVFYHTSSKKLARLNGIMVIAEFSIDEEGNTHEKLWEWK